MVITYKYIVLFLIFGLSFGTLRAQTTLADSLALALRNTTNERNKLLILNKLSDVLRKNNPQQAFIYNKQAIQIAKTIQEEYLLAEAYQQLAEIYRILGDYSKGLEYAIAGLEIAEKNKYDTLRLKTLDRVAVFNSFLASNDTTYKKKAFDYRYQTLALAHKLKDDKLFIIIYLNMGDLHRSQKNYDSALFYTEKAYDIAKKIDDVGEKGFALMNKGQILVEQGKYLSALPYLINAVKFLMSVDNKFDAAFALQLTAIVYREKGKKEQAFAYLNDALKLAQEIDSKADISEIYKQFYLTYEREGEIYKAFTFYKKYEAYKDSVFNESKSLQMAAMQSLHDAESKDKEIDLLKRNEQMREENLKQQQFLTIFLLSSFILSGLIALILYRNNRNKQKINQILARQNGEILRQQEEINAQKENIALQNEQLERKNHDLLFLNEEKNHLIGIVAHDLRNPLSQIKGLVNLLQLPEEDISKEEKEEYSRLVKSAIERMTQMINKTLDVNAIDSQKVNLSKEKLNIASILNTVCDGFENAAKAKSIQLIREITFPLFAANLDKNYLTQIFENLISNAIKYSPTHKSVSIKALYKEGVVRIEVQDEGQGISEADMKKMFGKFQQLSAKPTKGEASIGLGLSIVKKYVEAMNGKVWCESEVGKGANFVVEFKG